VAPRYERLSTHPVEKVCCVVSCDRAPVVDSVGAVELVDFAVGATAMPGWAASMTTMLVRRRARFARRSWLRPSTATFAGSVRRGLATGVSES